MNTFCKLCLNAECNDPARPPQKGCNAAYLHWTLRRFVENIYFRVFTFLLIITDIILVITELVIDCSWHPASIILRSGRGPFVKVEL